jgi:hypothetical protein
MGARLYFPTSIQQAFAARGKQKETQTVVQQTNNSRSTNKLVCC